ncbi:hypothetical protein GVN20_21940 [Runella sp. CRIBMP]|uniref:patatin-like phospholipase family protein n=1 Tax=Runella sp. CRIBMP TaxID=2683261 RepID=UPI001412881B|nr:patatin-like phospholipase family protein [Runella sp. CRIBMP]NBB22032.1 hypothetical protein [Runella sp. CRIBMP]
MKSSLLSLQKWLHRFFDLLRAFYLLFPASLSAIALWYSTWYLPQGRDLLISILEHPASRWSMLLALLFWAMVTWYSGRILIYREKKFFTTRSRFIGFHLPRFLGFTGIGLVAAAYFQLPITDAYYGFDWGGFHYQLWLWLLIGTGWYGLWAWLFTYLRDVIIPENRFRLLRYIWLGVMILLLTPSSIGMSGNFMVFSVILLQILFLFGVIFRRGKQRDTDDAERMPISYSSIQIWAQSEGKDPVYWYHYLLYYANIPFSERWFFLSFNIISVICLILYTITIFSVSFAGQTIGSFTFVLLAFGVLVGGAGLISIFSIAKRVNFYIIILLLMLAFGGLQKKDPHAVRTLPRQSSPKEIRPTFDEYFRQWVSRRKDSIQKDSIYPVYFLMADGGASRSGYWAASVWGKIQDKTSFSEHIFCLASASGGSVGNGTFLAALKNASLLPAHDSTFQSATQQLLSSNFLTFTLARMLGPDIIKLAGISVGQDRAVALEEAMEYAAKGLYAQHDVFSEPITHFIPTTRNLLPIVCFNTTRMQDGMPGVISTIQVNSFSKRIDVLDSTQDLRLSTAMVLSSRFPYISPAGLIGNSYYVDGGYFDNSGAGVVNEMLQKIKELKSDTTIDPALFNKLRFYVIHATNSPVDISEIELVHPLKNDLFAPIVTLVGAYGTQTTVNDLRLINALKEIGGGYIPIHLYRPNDAVNYPMNWAISKYYQMKMNHRLNNQDTLSKLITHIKSPI